MDDIAITNRTKTTGPLDPRVLAELAEIQRKGRPGFMQRVIARYLQTAAELIKELESASVKNEPGILYRASHTLKPCSAAVVRCQLRRVARHWKCDAAWLRPQSGSPC